MTRHRVTQQDFDTAAVKGRIKKLAKENKGDQGRAAELATVLWTKHDLHPFSHTLRVQNLLKWSVLEEEFKALATELFANGYTDDLPYYFDFLDILAREIRANQEAVENCTYEGKTAKRSAADYYAQSALRILMRMCRKDEQLANAVSWLGPDSEATSRRQSLYHIPRSIADASREVRAHLP